MGIGEETKRVVEEGTEGTAFSPAILNGEPVKVRKEQKLIFKVF